MSGDSPHRAVREALNGVGRDNGDPSASEFQLELLPDQPIRKLNEYGDPKLSATTPLDGIDESRFGIQLDSGESVVSPPLSIGKAHVLNVAIRAAPNEACLRIEYTQESSSSQWSTLAEVKLGGERAVPHQQIQLSLAGMAGHRCGFRVVRTDRSASPCYLAFFQICAAHNAGKVNALAGYGFRMKTEVQNFSGATYSHQIYGDGAQGGGVRGIVKPIAVVLAEDEDLSLEKQTANAWERLVTLNPVPGEAAYIYAMRALGTLLPITPPDFFARAKRLSETKPLRILSICAGAARVEAQILDHCQGPVEVTLMDASPDLIQDAADKLTSGRPERRVECLIGDVNAGLPGLGLFDVIICVSALHHVANLEIVLCQINQRLTDDGEFWSIGEQIGRNGNRLWPDAYEAANRAFESLPDRLRRNSPTGQIDRILSDRDFSTGCFEGVRSEELEQLLEAFFIPDHIYKRNAFLWRLVDATYSDNFSLDQAEDLHFLRELVIAEAIHWARGGRSTELHAVYRKKCLR